MNQINNLTTSHASSIQAAVSFLSSIPDYEHYYQYGLNQTSCSERTGIIRMHAQKNHVFPFIGQKSMNQITTDMIRNIIRKMQSKHLSSAMISSVFYEIKRTFSLAVKENILSVNPCNEIRYSRKQHSISSAFPITAQDHENFLSALQKIPLSNMFSFCYFTGIPFVTARNMKRKDVDIPQKKCMIRSGRSKGEIYLTDNIFKYIDSEYEKHEIASEEDYLFLSEKGSQISRRSLQANLHMLRTLLNQEWLNLPDITRSDPNLNHIYHD